MYRRAYTGNANNETSLRGREREREAEIMVVTVRFVGSTDRRSR